jgi:hypothetical protein
MPFVFHTNSVIGLKYFCKLIGDYESILMLLDTPTKPIVPSMNTVGGWALYAQSYTGT